jgi:hypothetical protein
MWFHALLSSLKSLSSVAGVRRSCSRSTSRLRVEALEDRAVPAAISDPVGDFLPTYTGPQLPGMDVVAHEVVVLEDQGRVIFSGRMAGPIAPTQAIGGLYLFGLDRGQGTPRFLGGTPPIGPNVLWDSLVIINPNGNGRVNNQVAGVVTLLNPADIHINGNEFTASVPLSLLLPAATRPPQEWTYNLWPRNNPNIGANASVSDLAPDDGNSPMQVVAPARVAGVAVNDGSAQRSMVNSITVTFDGPVTLDPGAFDLSRPDGTPVELTVATSVVDGRTVAVLTFSGPDVVGGSLADGSYILTVRADRVHDRWGRELDGNGDGSAGGNRVDGVSRLFGDTDGDGDVDHADLDRMLTSFGKNSGEAGFLWFLDYDGDGDVGGLDMAQFNHRRRS